MSSVGYFLSKGLYYPSVSKLICDSTSIYTCLSPHRELHLQGGQSLMLAHWVHFNGAKFRMVLSKQRGWKTLHYSSHNRISPAKFSTFMLPLSPHFLLARGSFHILTIPIPGLLVHCFPSAVICWTLPFFLTSLNEFLLYYTCYFLNKCHTSVQLFSCWLQLIVI